MMINLVKNYSELPRMERKYFLANHQAWILDYYVKSSVSGLKEIYYQRKINNVYFDTQDFSFLKDNLVGANLRMKLRLRWYGDTKMHNPNLEIKMKQGDLVYKLVKKYNSHDLPLQIKEVVKRLKPSLTNSYYRKYFLTANQKIRLTVDTRIMFENKLSDKTVVELKYSPESEKQASQLISSFPLGLQKNSKYVEGMAIKFS
ncbi:VTC domain-containing protein [Patescibacteria group bacterium]